MPFMEQQAHEQTSNPSVSIQEGMNSFELIMNHASSCQRWNIDLSMDELFQIVQGSLHFVDGRRYIGRCLDCATGWTDPVLAFAEFAWGEIATSYTFHQSGMNLPNQSQTNRQRLQTFPSIIKCQNIIVYFPHIIGRFQEG